MPVYKNIAGTTVSTFKIGKGGPTLHTGVSTPTGIDGDFWLDGAGQLKIKLSGVWEHIHFDNLKLSGNTISSTDTDGSVSIVPDGVGDVILGAAAGGTSTMTAPDDQDVIIQAGPGTGANSGGDLTLRGGAPEGAGSYGNVVLGNAAGGISTMLAPEDADAIIQAGPASVGNPGADFYIRGGDGTAGTGVDGNVIIDLGNLDLSNNDIINGGDIAATTFTGAIAGAVGYSILAKATTGAGNYSSLVAGTNGVLRRDGTGDIAFGTLVTNNIGDSQVTFAKVQDIATDTFLGRVTAGTGVAEVLTNAQAKSALDLAGSNTGDNPGVTNVNDGNGMTFTAITGTGDVVLGTPSTLTAATTNAVTTDSHTHAITGFSEDTHNHSLDSLSNVTITSNASGELLKWNGSAWINNTLAEAGIQAAGTYDNYVSWNVQANGGTQVAVTTGEEVNFVNGTYTTAAIAIQTNPTITFNHNDTTRSDTTSSSSPEHGGTFDIVSSVSTNTSGHVTAIDVKTVTLPAETDSQTLTWTPATNNLAITGGNNVTISQFDTVTATTFTGTLSGNAATATKWLNPRTITLSGDVSGTSPSWDGSGNLAFSGTVVANDSHTHAFNNLTGKTGGTGDYTTTGTFTATKGSFGTTADDVILEEDGIYFEQQKHAITFNDGFGNFNIRIGNNGLTNENCTEAGYISAIQNTQSSGVWTWAVSSASLAVDAAPTWRDQITLGPSTVALAYQGSTKIITNSGGVTITGTATATTFSGALSGNATTATTATNATNVNVLTTTTSASRPFVFATSTTAGNKALYTDTATTCYINPNTNVIGATTFIGALTGTATNATNVNVLQSTTSASRPFVFATSTTAGNKLLYTDSAATCYINPSTNVIGATSFIASSTVTAATVTTLSVQTSNGTQLLLEAGESPSQSTGQTAERVYVNAEAGLEVNSSPDNWATAWAGRDTAVICGAGGASTFPGDVTIAGATTLNGHVYLGSDAADSITFNGDTLGDITPNVNNVGSVGVSGRAYNAMYATGFVGTTLSLGAGVVLKESADRADLLEIKSSTSSWGGLTIRNTGDTYVWSVMADGTTFGIYDDLSNAWHIQCLDGGETRLYWAGAEKLNTTTGGVAVTGALTATGNITAYFTSDIRLKENVIPIPNALSKVSALSGNSYNFKPDVPVEESMSGLQYGLIAQEVQKVLPELVKENDEGNLVIRDSGFELTALLVEAINEQQQQIDKQDNAINTLMQRMEAMESKLK